MNHYETVFILTPVLSDVQMKEAVEKFKTILTEQGAVIVNEENWGLRKLAYPIQKKTTGFYHLLQFEAEGALVDKLETAYRRDERVIRFLTFRLDKYAYEYTLKCVKDDKVYDLTSFGKEAGFYIENENSVLFFGNRKNIEKSTSL